MTRSHEYRNPMGYGEIGPLIRQYAIPSIISGLVGALYNIVDQIFIGQGVGILGNAATNVAFPFTNMALALGLLVGVGASASYSLNLGRNKKDLAGNYIFQGLSLLFLVSLLLMVSTRIFLKPLLIGFGATEKVLPLAYEYMLMINLGMPALMGVAGLTNVIRADGGPKFAMMANLVGAIINTILDPIFIFVFKWGMAGAGLATIIGQYAGFILCLIYLMNLKSVDQKFHLPWPKWSYAKNIFSLGASPLINQMAFMVTQIVLNNVLTYFGGQSIYGAEIPLAAVGVISKVTVIYISFVIGVSGGAQPIIGYNYGAKQYDRVKEAYFKALKPIMICSVITFLIIEIFPKQILMLFGEGSDLYYQFGIKYFRIFCGTIFLDGIQPLTAFFFTGIGKALRGTLISLTRQIIFLVPLIYFFARFFGIEGVLYAGPISDIAAFAVSVVLIYKEILDMEKLKSQLA